MIALGLVLYAAGSVIGALTSSIGGVIAARLVQGAGAVSGPVTALLAGLVVSTAPALAPRRGIAFGALLAAVLPSSVACRGRFVNPSVQPRDMSV